MRAQILAIALTAGVAAAQTAPASQAVKPNPPQPSAKTDKAVKTAAKSPFAPKGKSTAQASHSTEKAQLAIKPETHAAASKQTVTIPAKTVSKAVPQASHSAGKTQVAAKPETHTTASKPAIAGPSKAAS